MANLHLWLRDETKPLEQRSALSPQDARLLIQNGIQLTVESSEVRIFNDNEFVRAGAKMVPSGAWRQAPQSAIILGLKELPEENTPLSHRHIYFAHAYKEQKGWQQLLGRFKAGGGTLLDLEYLTTAEGRRVAAFGRWAGFAGAAVGLKLWSHQVVNENAPLGKLSPEANQSRLIDGIRSSLENALTISAMPRVIVIGAKGRCGSGALDALSQCGIPSSHISAWDLEETATGGPFSAILDHDILINCVLVQGNTAPFLTKSMVSGPRRNLRVISDVSCDPHSPFNPLPVYDRTTTFAEPSLRILERQNLGLPPVDLTAIDHLPSLLPKESSEDFSSQLTPHLLQLTSDDSGVWSRANSIFHKFVERI
jgi:hypothetical protein